MVAFIFHPLAFGLCSEALCVFSTGIFSHIIFLAYLIIWCNLSLTVSVKTTANWAKHLKEMLSCIEKRLEQDQCSWEEWSTQAFPLECIPNCGSWLSIFISIADVKKINTMAWNNRIILSYSHYFLKKQYLELLKKIKSSSQKCCVPCRASKTFSFSLMASIYIFLAHGPSLNPRLQCFQMFWQTAICFWTLKKSLISSILHE